MNKYSPVYPGLIVPVGLSSIEIMCLLRRKLLFYDPKGIFMRIISINIYGVDIQSDLSEKSDIQRVTPSFNKSVGMFL